MIYKLLDTTVNLSSISVPFAALCFLKLTLIDLHTSYFGLFRFLSSTKYMFGSPQNWQEVVSKSNDNLAQSVVSVKVASDISALCNASNDMGTEVKSFSIKASKFFPLSFPVWMDHGMELWVEKETH